MINNPDTQPKHVEQSPAAEVTPSVLHSGAVAEFQKLYDALLMQVRMHERRGLAVPVAISMLLLTLALTLSPGTAETTYAKTGDQDKTEQTATPEDEGTWITSYPATQGIIEMMPNLEGILEQMPIGIYGQHLEVRLNYADGALLPSVRFEKSDGRRMPNSVFATAEAQAGVETPTADPTIILELTADAWADMLLADPNYKEFANTLPERKRFIPKVIVKKLEERVDDGELQEMVFEFEVTLKYVISDLEDKTVVATFSITGEPNEAGDKLYITTYDTQVETPLTAAATAQADATATRVAEQTEEAQPTNTPIPTGTPTPAGDSSLEGKGKPRFGDLDLRPTDQRGKPTVEPTATALGTPVPTSENAEEDANTPTATATRTPVGTPTAEGTSTLEAEPTPTAELARPERSAVTAEDLAPFGESVVRNVGEYIERKVFVSVGEKDTTYPRYSFLEYQNEHPSLSDNYRTRITQSQLELGPRDIRFGEVSISEDGTQLWVADALAEEGQEPTLLTVQLPEGHRFVVQGEPQVRSNASGSLTVIEGVAMQQGNDPVDADNPALILKWITLPGATKLAEKLDISVDTELVTALRGPSLEQIEMLPGERLAAYDNVVYGVTVNTEGIHLRQLDSTKGLEVFRVLDSDGTFQSDGRYPAVPYTQTITWDAFSARGFDPSNIATVEATTVLLRGPLQREPYMAPEDDVLTIELKGKQNPPGEDFEGYLIFQASLTSMYGDYSQSGSTQDYTGLEFKFVEGRSNIYVDLPKPTPTPTESPRAAETMTIQDKMNFFAEEVAAGRVSVAEQARWQLFVALWQTDQLIEPQVANVKVLGEPEHDNLFINEVLDTQQFPDIFSDQRAESPIYIMQVKYNGVYFRFIQPEWIDGKLQVVILDGITGNALKNDQKDIVAEYLNNLNLPYVLVAGNYVYSVFSGVDTFRPFYPSN